MSIIKLNGAIFINGIEHCGEKIEEQLCHSQLLSPVQSLGFLRGYVTIETLFTSALLN